MNRLKFYLFAIQLMAPFFMLVASVYAEDQNMILKGKGLDAVFISIKTNDQVINDSLAKELRSYMEKRIHEIGIKSSASMDDKSGAELVLGFYIGSVNDSRKILGYENVVQRKFLVFMELSLEQPVTLNRDPSITAVVPTWTSGMKPQIGKGGHRPFVSRKLEFKKDIFAELINLMDEFVALHKSTAINRIGFRLK